MCLIIFCLLLALAIGYFNMQKMKTNLEKISHKSNAKLTANNGSISAIIFADLSN